MDRNESKVVYKARGGGVVTRRDVARVKAEQLNALGKKTTDGERFGYADTPGTGPEGMCCRNCYWCVRHAGNGRDWFKCLLTEQHWTQSTRTDIRASAPSCRLFRESGAGGILGFWSRAEVAVRRGEVKAWLAMMGIKKL